MMFKQNGKATNGLHKTNISNSAAHLSYRLVGYSIGAAVHLTNILAMAWCLRGPIMRDPDVQHFYSMEFNYITIWNLIFQLVYIGLGFACDVPALTERNYGVLQWLRRYRKVFYSGIIWPCGLAIFIIYWPIYVYDRNLIFPEYIDKALHQASNYVMHMFIAFPILWDLVFLPNQKPRSQKYILGHTYGLIVIYLISLLSLYAQRGVWPYPGLKLVYGTIYFPLTILGVILISLVIYYAQWPLISYVWRKKSTK